MSLLSNKFKDINNITYAHKNGLLIKPVLTAGCEQGVTPGPHMLHYRCLDVFSSSGALKNMFIKSNNYPSKKMISWIYLCRVYYLFVYPTHSDSFSFPFSVKTHVSNSHIN